MRGRLPGEGQSRQGMILRARRIGVMDLLDFQRAADARRQCEAEPLHRRQRNMPALAVAIDGGVDLGRQFERQLVGERHAHRHDKSPAPVARTDGRAAGRQRHEWLQGQRKTAAVGAAQAALVGQGHVAEPGRPADRAIGAIARHAERRQPQLHFAARIEPDAQQQVARHDRVDAVAILTIERPVGKTELGQHMTGLDDAGRRRQPRPRRTKRTFRGIGQGGKQRQQARRPPLGFTACHRTSLAARLYARPPF